MHYFLEFHKPPPIDIKKIESLYFICISECPLYSHGLFDYGKFLFSRCAMYNKGLEFMSFGAIESVFQESYKEQIQHYIICCDLNDINVDKNLFEIFK